MKHYTIVFDTTTGSRRSIRINNPNPDLPLPEIHAAIDQIVENDVFNDERGALEGLNSMTLSVVERIQVI